MQEAFAIGFANVVGAFFRNDFTFNKWPQNLSSVKLWPQDELHVKHLDDTFYYAMSSKCIFDPRENF